MSMNIILSLSGLLLLTAATSPAQSLPDSLARKEQRQQRTRFVDENGDGVNDRAGQAGKRLNRRMDRFVDANGDGICDSREHGLGFQRSGVGPGLQRGKKGQGGKP